MENKPVENHRSFGPDLIRAIAIVLVLMAHTIPGGTMFPILGATRDYWGILGVEIFFLLSGYLIGGILMADLFAGRLDSLGGVGIFWKRRWFRTLPNYYLFLLLMLLASPFVDGHFPSTFGNFFWFGQALLSMHPAFFFAAWSLAIEEWFYILFPTTLFFLCRLTGKRKHGLLGAMVVFLVAPVIIRSFLSETNWQIVRGMTLPRLDAIGYGVVLAFMKNYRPGAWKFMVKLWPMGVVAILGIFGHFYHHANPAGAFYNSAAYSAFFFCLLSLSLALVFPKVAEASPPAGWPAVAVRNLSLWSYSIYLSHGIFTGLISLGLKYMGASYALWHIISGPLIWLVTIPCSAMIYKFYEKPCMNLRDQPLKSFWPALR